MPEDNEAFQLQVFLIKNNISDQLCSMSATVTPDDVTSTNCVKLGFTHPSIKKLVLLLVSSKPQGLRYQRSLPSWALASFAHSAGASLLLL